NEYIVVLKTKSPEEAQEQFKSFGQCFGLSLPLADLLSDESMGDKCIKSASLNIPSTSDLPNISDNKYFRDLSFVSNFFAFSGYYNPDVVKALSEWDVVHLVSDGIDIAHPEFEGRAKLGKSVCTGCPPCAFDDHG
ncbi:13486_t:CDS:2, partial [Racocetra fulgida]